MSDDDPGQAVAATSGHGQEVRSDSVTLHVFVRDQGGGALAEVNVRASSSGRSVGSGVTDATGMMTMSVPRGRALDLRARFDPGRGSDARSANRRAFGEGTGAITATEEPSYATVFVPRPHQLARPFPWQNEVIRRTIYRDDGENDDPGTRRVRGEELADRKRRLLEIINHARHFMDNPPGPPGNETPQLRHDREVATRTARERQTAEQEYDRARHRPRQILRQDIPATRRRRDLDRDGRRARIGTLRQERRDLLESLPERRRERDRARETDDEAQRQLAHSEREALEGLSHDELMVYIIDRLFAADSSGQHLPPWVRYLILHYTGFRYAVAHRSYYPPQWLVFNLQSYRIEQDEAGLSEAQQDHALGEIRALVAHDEELGARIRQHLGYFVHGEDRTMRGPRRAPKRRLRPVRVRDPFDVDALLEAASAGRTPRGRRIRRPYRSGAKAAAVSDLQKALAHACAMHADTNEAMGLLKHHRAEGVLEHHDDQWRSVVKHTHLRCDEVTSDDWQDVEYRRFSNPWRGIFGDNTQREWGKVNAEDLSVTVIRCECNEIAEIAASARGVTMGGRGLRGDADQLDNPQASDDEEDSAEDNTEEPGSPVAEHAYDHRLFRIQHVNELRPGDVMFHIVWSAIPSLGNADPGKCVAVGLDMAYMAGPSDTIDTGSLQFAAEVKLQRGRSDPPRVETPPENHALHAYAYVKPNRQDVRMIVRRSNVHFTKYDEYLRFSHIFTVVAVHGNFAYTFETNAPVGMKRRPQNQLTAWDYVVARPATPDAATQQALARRLAPYLDRSRLLLRRRRGS